MRKTYLAFLAALSVGGCVDLELGTGLDLGLDSCYWSCTPFGLNPSGELRAVRGDTIRIFAFSDSGYNTAATWRAEGSSVRLVASDGSLTTMSATRDKEALIKVVENGVGSITAEIPNYSAISRFIVTDSSDVVSMQVDVDFANWSVGSIGRLSSWLEDGHRRPYYTFPAFTINEPGRMQIERRFDPVLFGVHHVAIAKAPGPVRIIASFGALRDTIDIVIH